MRTIVRGHSNIFLRILKNGVVMRFSTDIDAWHGPCHIYLAKLIQTPWRTAMKFETLMLHSLFAACLVICVTTLGAMLV